MRKPSTYRELTIADLHRLLVLDASTGQLHWRERSPSEFRDSSRNSADALCQMWNKRFAGREALCVPDGRGYLRGRILLTKFRAHMVVFAMTRGHWPEGQIDHINGDRSDNRPHNLRDVSAVENARNSKLRAGNTTGCAGVHWNKKDRCYCVTIRVDGRNKHLGRYRDLDEAIRVRKRAETAAGYHPNHGRPA